jgi:hypothetical protein
LLALGAALMMGLGMAQTGGSPIKAARAFDPTRAPEIQDRLLDGLADFEFKFDTGAGSHESGTDQHSSNLKGCLGNIENNIKVNQNCLNITDASLQGRAQAENETSIAQDQVQPEHLISSYNDYRRGDSGCYTASSIDGGHSWTDSTPPMGFTRGTKFGGVARQYWQAGGDTSVAWDTRGNAYLSCQVFMRGSPPTNNHDLSSAFYVFRSTGNFGASWNFPGRPVAESSDVAGAGNAFLDKQLMTIDNHVGSPFRDRIYVSWTTFDTDGTAYIYEAYSKDYAEHFSAPVLVSHSSPLCAYDYSDQGVSPTHGPCDENQFSQPFTGSDGALYVGFNNFNNAEAGAAVHGGADNRNHVLLAKSTDGGATFGPLVNVGDYFDLPDCATYQSGADPGRACVPEKASSTRSIFRATNYSSGAVSPGNPSQIEVTYGSYINSSSKESNGCTPAGINVPPAGDGNNLYTGVKTPGACNNKILLSVSTNGGASFSGSSADPRLMATVNTPSQVGSDQWWQWAAFNKEGSLAVSYYDRQYGDDETTGNSDLSLSGSQNLSGFGVSRVTSSSMPPPTQFGGVFFGDYTGLTAFDDAHPLWMDTRNPDLFLCPGTAVPGTPPTLCGGTVSGGFEMGLAANDEEIFTRGMRIPGGSEDHGD